MAVSGLITGLHCKPTFKTLWCVQFTAKNIYQNILK
uniref:Uncharacterized protein n=1 Tax=Anguilla anguilla TaxID=7936 RepID=A0A0E9UHV5_ANGAN